MSIASPLEQSILETVVYFDIFDFPLTKEALFRFLWQPPPVSREMFETALSGMVGSILQTKKERYFLSGKEQLVEKQESRLGITKQKLCKAKRAAKLLSSIPFLRAIFVSSSVAAGTARPESDIDFFIITEKKRIWLVRLFTNLILRLLGLRVYGEKRKDRICLCFFVDTDHLDLSPWQAASPDIHFAYWLHQMIPLYDPKDHHAQFIAANGWTKSHLPFVRSHVTSNHPATIANGNIGKVWKTAWEKMWDGSYGNLIENEAKKLQWGMMKTSLKEKAKMTDHHVVISDGVLKLHENDAREVYREKWLEKVQKIIISNSPNA
ncbi:MAG TPA: nucleotidyltransferase domain-containing protein [Patescibacteria group bacterium]|nr:nucleotidyltransferase domain-containing protein [Patescibacteria group bacterium]